MDVLYIYAPIRNTVSLHTGEKRIILHSYTQSKLKRYGHIFFRARFMNECQHLKCRHSCNASVVIFLRRFFFPFFNLASVTLTF